MNTPPTTDAFTPRTMWTDLLDSWDLQQEVYIERRESRFGLMLDLIDRLGPDRPLRVVDVACGPGSLSRRVLDRFPDSRVVAVDMDPVLLAIGRRALAVHEGRLQWVERDLRDETWVGAVGTEPVDVVVSSTATHWLSRRELATLYRQLRSLLGPGGILLNADFMPLAPGGIVEAVRSVDEHRQRAATAAGAQAWETWWTSVVAEPELKAEVDRRNDLLESTGGSSSERDSATSDDHCAALRSAGFAEAVTVWQDLQEFLVVAIT